ncbi:MAG TPA: iron-sulfur cluster carrier protein ApbC, partial [Gammaproteobacteria bacterium]|nr:iron-sulfur cluster carrier protein ApbC [Gammaproteobacteria bacterium]
MTAVSRTDVENALKGYIDPYLEQDLATAKCIKQIQTRDDGQIEINVELGFPAAGYQDTLIAALRGQLAILPGVSEVTIHVNSKIIAHEVQKGLKPLPEVRNIIAVASGKGGVGKSTTAVNLALALSAEGARVGLLDADIYGPSQPRMLGANQQPESPDGKSLLPIVSYNIQSMSIGYLIEEETPMVW